jgi:hypothetical protein
MTLPLPTALTPDVIAASELGQNSPAYRAAPYPHNRLQFVLPILLDWWMGLSVLRHCQVIVKKCDYPEGRAFDSEIFATTFSRSRFVRRSRFLLRSRSLNPRLHGFQQCFKIVGAIVTNAIDEECGCSIYSTAHTAHKVFTDPRHIDMAI